MANSGNPLNPMPADPARMASAGMPPAANASIEARRTFLAAMNKALEADEPTRSPEALDQWLDAASTRRLDGDGLGRTGAAMLAAGDMRSRLASITAPTLVVHGAKDPLVAAAAGKEVAEAIPGAQWRLEPKMGHAINDPAIAAVQAFIQKN
jgi:pimeloyl-ACP methyl ester carboxylesterase